MENKFYDPMLPNAQLWRRMDAGDLVILHGNSLWNAGVKMNEEFFNVYIVLDSSYVNSTQMKLFSMKEQRVVNFNPSFRHGDSVIRINEDMNWKFGPYEE